MVDTYPERKYVILSIIIVIVIIFILRLYNLQVEDDTYKLSAANNSQRTVIEYPARGLIYDRDSNLLVYNEVTYDIIINPRQLTPFDTTELCKYLNITKTELLERIHKAIEKSPYKTSTLFRQVNIEVSAKFQEQLYKFKGFEIQRRTLRKYKKQIAAHLLGYIGEVSETVVKKQPYYRPGDYIGISGIEATYETVLRGKKGVKMYLVDVQNRIQGSFKNGKYDTMAVAGKNIQITLDSDLQEYCELLMKNKKGSIVAINPQNGEILALVSSPSYDPNLLVGKIRSENYQKFAKDKHKPLYNRALMANYPPGSTFKMVNALIGLQEGVLTTRSTFPCYGGFHVGNFTLKCHHASQIGLEYSIMSSCNAFYCHVFKDLLQGKDGSDVRENYNTWISYLNRFGVGVRLGSDVGYESPGFLPTLEYYDRFYGKSKWKPLMLVSMSIGQGELGVTPFQMANMVSIIANKGDYYTPHIIKQIGEKEDSIAIDSEYTTRKNVGVEKKYFEPIIDGMELVLKPGGTAQNVGYYRLSLCGKTGTAQNPHGEDHSIFVAFAPKENPQIAISVYVENGGFGSHWAAPISSLLAEKYLLDSISRKTLQEHIINTNLIKINEERKQRKLQAAQRNQENKK